jgi:hypothetical protein|tara:strand:- start:47 stop:541 length:495 start_codon:yes stop_codon:yes gene_type:complete
MPYEIQPRIFLFLLLSLSFQTVFSQFQNQMLSSMGSTSETSSGIIATQTIGQTSVIGFYKNSRTVVSQGYQKPLLNKIISNLQANTLDIKVFPNPFVDQININYFGEDQLSISLFDVTGKLIYSHELVFSSFTKVIDFKRLPAGFYFATISSKTSIFNTKLIKR